MTAGPDHAILYDADCGFCTRMLDGVLRWDRRARLRAVPIQGKEGDRLLAAVPAAERLDSWHLVAPAGEVHSAGAAGPVLLRLLPGGALPAALLAAMPRLTEAAYRWIAAHRELLGRFLSLALALVIVGCGSTVQAGSELTVYLSATVRGPDAGPGRSLLRGAELALADAGGEAGGAPVRLEVLDLGAPPSSRAAGQSGAAARDWQQAEIAANARTAAEDSTTIAYLGELESGATLISAPITNEAGILQLAPGPVAQGLLAEPGGSDVPSVSQPTGERTLGALLPAGSELRGGEAEAYGYEAMALILDSIDGAGDPLSRADVLDAFYATADRSSALGTYTIGPGGRAAFAPPGPQAP